MAGTGAVCLFLALIIASFQGQISAQTTCYSCNSAITSGSCPYSSVSGIPTTSCSGGCYTNVTSNYQVTRGCALAGYTNGCTYDSSSGAICTTVCNSDNCNGVVKELDTGCYSCFPSSTNSYCQSVTSTTGVTTCNYPSCATATTYNSDGSIANVQLGCGLYPAYNFTYTNSAGQKVVTTQCNSSFCNSEGGSAVSAPTSGVQCYSCSYPNPDDNNNLQTALCDTVVNANSVGTVTCPSGSCSTMAVYGGPSNQLQSIARGCGESSCLSTGCMTSGGYTFCWSTCQSSNCNANLTNTARPDTGSCNNAPGISGNIPTLWCLLTLVAMFLIFYSEQSQWF